jgi:hypothetical protein
MARIKTLLGLLVFVTAAYMGWMLLPVYMANYQFQDAIVTSAKFSGTGFKSEDDIHEEVMKKAKELDVPVKPDEVKVTRNGNSVDISADYTVIIDLINGKQLTLHFTPSSREKSDAGTQEQKSKSK